MTILIYLFISILIPVALSRRNINVYYKDNQHPVVKYKWSSFLLIAMVLCVILKGYAFDTGSDYLSYYEYVIHGFSTHKTEFELGFSRFVQLLNSISLPYQVFFLIAAILYYLGIMQLAKHFHYASRIIVFLWSVFFIVLSLNLYRQYYAISFLCFAVYNYLNSDYKKAIIWALLAISFHSSAMLCIPFFIMSDFIKRYQIKYWCIALPIIATSALGNAFNGVLEYVYNIVAPYFLLTNDSIYDIHEIFKTQYNTSYAPLLCLFNLLWSFMGYKTLKIYPHVTPIYYMSVIYFILYPICQQEILSRIAMYFMIYVPVLLGIIWYQAFAEYKRGVNRILFIVFVCSIVVRIALMIYSLNSLEANHPYKLIFEQPL